MPRGDRTGPNGFGPMTGRRAGYCSGSGVPGYMNPYGGHGYGFGFGYGRGFGRGWGRGFGYGPVAYQPVAGTAVPPNPEVERWNLERQAEYLEEELKFIRKRLTDLETSETNKENKNK